MDILDQILAADMAKQYSDSKGGYTKPGKVYTYDGGEDGEFVDLFGSKYVLLSKDVPDLHSIVKATFITGTAQQVEFAKGDFTFKENYGAEGVNAVLVTVSGVTAPVVLAVEGIGFYGFATPGVDYLSYVEFAETIVPIDQKFLPGVCLPVVELETTVVSEAAFTDAENAMLTQAFDSGLPPVINANFSDGVSIYQNVATVAQTATVDSNRAYLVQQGSFVYQIISADGVTWVVL